MSTIQETISFVLSAILGIELFFFVKDITNYPKILDYKYTYYFVSRIKNTIKNKPITSLSSKLG